MDFNNIKTPHLPGADEAFNIINRYYERTAAFKSAAFSSFLSKSTTIGVEIHNEE